MDRRGLSEFNALLTTAFARLINIVSAGLAYRARARARELRHSGIGAFLRATFERGATYPTPFPRLQRLIADCRAVTRSSFFFSRAFLLYTLQAAPAWKNTPSLEQARRVFLRDQTARGASRTIDKIINLEICTSRRRSDIQPYRESVIPVCRGEPRYLRVSWRSALFRERCRMY